MLGEAVEALASAHRRAVEAAERIARQEELRLRFTELNDHEAAKAVTRQLEELATDLAYFEAVLVAVSFRVRHLFTTLGSDVTEFTALKSSARS